MKNVLRNIFYSFPIQLVVLHIKNNHLFLLFWVLLGAMATGAIGKTYGTKYLFLNPEYLGHVSFYSFFILGMAFGGFIMSWNITIYILNSFRFPFLASLGRPFTKFCLNNSLVPLSFLVLYFIFVVHFQWYNEVASIFTIVVYCLGFVLGLSFMLAMTALYFQLTNKDILNFRKAKKTFHPKNPISIAARKIQQREEEQLNSRAWPVEYYVTENLSARLTRNVDHYSPELLMKVFRQNNGNALVFQVASIMLLIGFGSLIENPFFRIPAGASSMIFFAIFISITGAISYWFGSWRTTVFIFLIVMINFFSGKTVLQNENSAYGLDYSQLQPYTYSNIDSIHNKEQYYKDIDSTLKILDNWRSKFSKGRLIRKPKMVMVVTSGGGLRQAVWSMQVLQTADSLMNGKLLRNTVLMCGASGGMLGTAYMRELKLRQQQGTDINIYDEKHLDAMAKDLLNPIIFTTVANDLFLPWMTFKKNGHKYRKDRGYIFEKQFVENLNGYLDKDLIDYRIPEQQADIPMMFVTPVIINDARRLIISPQGVSYMAKSEMGNYDKGVTEIDAIDFGQFFADQDAYKMSFSSALRMNCTYPYILPAVHLPSEPPIQVMDAGWRDNYGIESVARFASVFDDWIKENTSGIVIVQIRGSDKVDEIESEISNGIINRMFNPLNVAALSSTVQDYTHDHQLDYVAKVLAPKKIDMVRFIYRPSKTNARASMTWHLTTREKIDILNAIYHEDNQESLQRLKELVK